MTWPAYHFLSAPPPRPLPPLSALLSSEPPTQDKEMDAMVLHLAVRVIMIITSTPKRN